MGHASLRATSSTRFVLGTVLVLGAACGNTEVNESGVASSAGTTGAAGTTGSSGTTASAGTSASAGTTSNGGAATMGGGGHGGTSLGVGGSVASGGAGAGSSNTGGTGAGATAGTVGTGGNTTGAGGNPGTSGAGGSVISGAGAGGAAPSGCQSTSAVTVTSGAVKTALAVATDGTSYMLAFTDKPSGTTALQFAVSDASGTLSVTPTTLIDGATAPSDPTVNPYSIGNQRDFGVTYSSGRKDFAVAWHTGAGCTGTNECDIEVWAQWISTAGVPKKMPLDAGQVAWTAPTIGGDMAMVWADGVNYVRVPNAALGTIILDQEAPKSSAGNGTGSAVATDGTSFLGLNLNASSADRYITAVDHLGTLTYMNTLHQLSGMAPFTAGMLGSIAGWDPQLSGLVSVAQGTNGLTVEQVGQDGTILEADSIEVAATTSPLDVLFVPDGSGGKGSYAILSTDGAVLYFSLFDKQTRKAQSPTIVGAGSAISNGRMFATGTSFVAFWLQDGQVQQSAVTCPLGSWCFSPRPARSR